MRYDANCIDPIFDMSVEAQRRIGELGGYEDGLDELGRRLALRPPIALPEVTFTAAELAAICRDDGGESDAWDDEEEDDPWANRCQAV